MRIGLGFDDDELLNLKDHDNGCGDGERRVLNKCSVISYKAITIGVSNIVVLVR